MSRPPTPTDFFFYCSLVETHVCTLIHTCVHAAHRPTVTHTHTQLTDKDHQPVSSSAGPAVGGDLLVGGHVGHVVQFALLALVHRLVGLLAPAAEAEASPEPG